MEIKVGDLVEVIGYKGHCEEHRGTVAEIWECGVIILDNQGLTNIPYFKADELKLIEKANSNISISRKEKLLLLDLILQDIRGNWGFDVESRIATAFELAEDLGLSQFIQSINEFEELYECGDGDGRFFRMGHEFGGYIGLESQHKLPYTIMDKSKEFKNEAECLTYPDSLFEDWDQYMNRCI